MVPELSSSYRWTVGAVAGRNAKVPIYILAEDELEVRRSEHAIMICCIYFLCAF